MVKVLYFSQKPLPPQVKVLFLGNVLTTFSKGGGILMKKLRINLKELMQKNKEEMLKDKEQLEKIEKDIEEKYIQQSIGKQSNI